MNLTLTAITGSYEGTVMVVLPGECFSFGRTPAAQRSFPQDTHMSSQHFEIENYGDFAEVRDKGSTNGTWLNNSRVTQQVLKSGDQLRAGTTVFAIDFDRKSSNEINPSPNDSAGFSRADVTDQELPSPRLDLDRFSSVLPPDASSHDAPPDSPKLPPVRLNPFSDSINVASFEVNTPLASHPLETKSGDSLDRGGRLSPFTDSIVIPDEKPEEKHSVASKYESESEPFDFLALRLEGPSKDGWLITVDRLSRIYSVIPVVHPLKIRQSIPESCESLIYLWNVFGHSQELGPIALSWADFKRSFEPFIARLMTADSLMVFFGTSYEKLAMHLEKMTILGVQGFSEEGGFLSCFWPSSMVTILQTLGRQRCAALFEESAVGVLMPCPSDERIIIAVGCHRFCQALKDLGFESINRLTDF